MGHGQQLIEQDLFATGHTACLVYAEAIGNLAAGDVGCNVEDEFHRVAAEVDPDYFVAKFGVAVVVIVVVVIQEFETEGEVAIAYAIFEVESLPEVIRETVLVRLLPFEFCRKFLDCAWAVQCGGTGKRLSGHLLVCRMFRFAGAVLLFPRMGTAACVDNEYFKELCAYYYLIKIKVLFHESLKSVL